jgi:gliding motility-associated-like protein
VSDFSTEACTFFLTGEQQEYLIDLNWTPYLHFPNGVQTYEVWRRDQSAAYPGVMYHDNGTGLRYFRDDDIHIPRPCYRIRAVEFDPGCGYESWSNEVCFVMPPTLFLPNAFTPNGDGLNDMFISGGEFTETFHLDVYDRWGMLIFEAQTQTEGWDGTYKGNPVAEGTYVWHVRATGYGGQSLQTQGSVLVIR